MAAQAAGIRVSGLRELRLALGAIDQRFPAELRRESGEIADDVRDLAKAKLRGDVGPESTGAAEGSIRSFSNARSAGVRGGRASVPYFGWLEFGGVIRHHGSRHSHSTAHLIRREVIRRGRYLYPAADELATKAAPRVERLIDRLFREAGFDD